MNLAKQVIKVCKKRGWSLHWTHRGAYLQLESSELIESIRGKRGIPLKESADVLFVLMSITENEGIPWEKVEKQTQKLVDDLNVKDGEEFGRIWKTTLKQSGRQ